MYRTAVGGASPNVTDLRNRPMLHKAHQRTLSPVSLMSQISAN